MHQFCSWDDIPLKHQLPSHFRPWKRGSSLAQVCQSDNSLAQSSNTSISPLSDREPSMRLSDRTLSAPSCESLHSLFPQRDLLTTHISFSGVCFQPLQQAAYRKRCLKAGRPVPEALWWSAMWATPFMPIGLAIASAFSGPQYPWMAPLVSSI